MSKSVIQTNGLEKQYGKQRVLSDCSINIPEGSIAALVGPNGAGKTTLLRLLAGQIKASRGTISVLGTQPAQSTSFLANVGYVAQNVPLYTQLDATVHEGMGAHLNSNWDRQLFYGHLERLNIPTNQPVGKLSGGQQAQVGLALALAKRPKLLILDEPVAALDPLARRDFLASLVNGVAGGESSVIMSSHILGDLENIADYLVLLDEGKIQLNDDIDHILTTHVALRGEPAAIDKLGDKIEIIRRDHSRREDFVLARLRQSIRRSALSNIDSLPTKLEDIVLAYMEFKGSKTVKEQR